MYYNYRCSCNDSDFCKWNCISELDLEKLLFDNIISKIQLDEKHLKVIEMIINQKLLELWKIEEDKWTRIRETISIKKEKLEDYFYKYEAEDEWFMKNKYKSLFNQLNAEIVELEKELEELPEKIEEEKSDTKELLEYAKEVWNSFIDYPRIKKQKMAKEIFEYIIIKDKEIVDFRLKPLFNMILKKDEVLTLYKKQNKNNSWSYNSKNKKNKPIKACSSNSVPFGTANRNRTCITAFAGPYSIRWNMAA